MKHPILNLQMKRVRDELRWKSRYVAQSLWLLFLVGGLVYISAKTVSLAQIYFLKWYSILQIIIIEVIFLHSLQFDTFGL